MNRSAITVLIILIALPGMAQTKQEPGLKREITLYNPYKPTLMDVTKRSFLPDMSDTVKIRPDFSYEIKTSPFMPPYTVSPIKAAAMVPDPLPKLYNSFMNFGFGTHFTPVAELSISNQRSKKGNIGFYGRHFSENDDIKLSESVRPYAGFMDNDASVYGRKLMRHSVLKGSVDFAQRTRYAYGYDTIFNEYNPDKKDIRISYMDAGAEIGLSSITSDSSDLAYDFTLDYSYFFSGKNYSLQTIKFEGEMARTWKRFYVGSGADFHYYIPSDSVSANTVYTAAVSPFIKMKSAEWNARIGFRFLAEKGFDEPLKVHLYPDMAFGFRIIPDYISFFAELSGRLEENRPERVLNINPFLLPGKSIYTLKNTDYPIVVSAGLTGETGINGRYCLSGTYSMLNDMLMFSNYILSDSSGYSSRGNYFIPVYDQAEILNIHGEISGQVNKEISFKSEANFYRYTLADSKYAWNRPEWDAAINLNYNLRNKIIAEFGVNAVGYRIGLTTYWNKTDVLTPLTWMTGQPATVNFNFMSEYRYTKILSFWLRFDNISFSRQYEWAYYPSQRFFVLAGFRYSL